MISQESTLLQRTRQIELVEASLAQKLQRKREEDDARNDYVLRRKEEEQGLKSLIFEAKDKMERAEEVRREAEREKELVRRKEIELEAKNQIINAERKEVTQKKHELAMTARTLDNLRFKVVRNMSPPSSLMPPAPSSLPPPPSTHSQLNSFYNQNGRTALANSVSVKNFGVGTSPSAIQNPLSYHPPSSARKSKENFNVAGYMEFLKGVREDVMGGGVYLEKEKENLMIIRK